MKKAEALSVDFIFLKWYDKKKTKIVSDIIIFYIIIKFH